MMENNNLSDKLGAGEEVVVRGASRRVSILPHDSAVLLGGQTERDMGRHDPSGRHR